MTIATGNPPTSAPARTGGGVVAPGPGRAPARRVRTDRRLGRTRVAVAVGALLFGAAGITSVQIRADGSDDVKSHSGVMIQQAEQIYHNLSDADATAATIYLHVGEAPKALLERYDSDLRNAQSALLAATNEAGDDATAKDALNQIAQQLPIYVKLNATAAANNLIGYPVGFRYLTQASALMQGTILTQAQKLTVAESANLANAENTATQFPWLMVGVGTVLLILLLMLQAREFRRTNRVFNLGLLGATAALVLSLVWVAAATLIQNGHMDKAQKRGSDQVSVLATARVLSLQARTDEMLTLVGRGTADDKEADYVGSVKDGVRVAGTREKLAAALQKAQSGAPDADAQSTAAKAVGDEGQWNTQHQQLRNFDRQNQYQKAVDSALGEGDFAAPQQSAAQSFDNLQNDLDKAIKHAEDSFTSEAKSAAGALTGLEIGLGVLAVAMAGAVVVGLGRRLAEYH